MVIDRPTRQVDDFLGLGADGRIPRLVREAHHRIGIGDVQPVIHKRHAEGREQPLQQHAALLGHAVPVGIAQQGDAVGAGDLGASLGHDLLGHPALDAFGLFLRRCGALCHQHVTIGQHVEPARMFELVGEALYFQAFGRPWRLVDGPAGGGGDVDGG